MNRNITECFSATAKAEDQGKVMHKYILGVYDLYNRLTSKYPEILFESCASGGARFDPGMLFYAPQTWTSDDTDAIERLKFNTELQWFTQFVVWGLTFLPFRIIKHLDRFHLVHVQMLLIRNIWI